MTTIRFSERKTTSEASTQRCFFVTCECWLAIKQQNRLRRTLGEKLVRCGQPAIVMRSQRLAGTFLTWLADMMLLAWILLMYGSR